MNVLGISGRDRDAAAALAVDGRIVAAATEDSFARVAGIGYELTGGFPHAAVSACLDVAGLDRAGVDEIVVVDETAGGGPAATRQVDAFDAPRRTIPAARADAVQAAMNDPHLSAVVVCGSRPPVLAAFAREGDGLGPRVDIPGARGVVDAARSLASMLGIEGGGADPIAGLDRLSVGAEPEFQQEMKGALQWQEGLGVVANHSTLVETARRVAGPHAAGLADGRSMNARIQHARQALAASFTSALAHALAGVAESVAVGRKPGPIGVGGDVFGNARFNTEFTRLMGNAVSFSAVPEAAGRALGALGAAVATPRSGLALGPAFSEEDVKHTLDNCRLDYVYEPDWTRLLARVSRMLAQGKVVGWFQGPMAFGPRALGTRSILGDPANRYARHNLNEHLRNLPLDEPLPVVVTPSLSARCFVGACPPARAVSDAEVRPEWRQSLVAALDWRHAVRVHGFDARLAPGLGELLELHYAATGTPGLIETNLCSAGEPIACTPRDAVRTVYSSAVDALVIGRFLLMKDYWLLRTQDK